MPSAEPVQGNRARLLLYAVLALAVVLRFSTLGLQSYWSDEASTVDLVRSSLGHMLSTIPHTERTPPLYYVVAWVWSRVFGSAEFGLRSLSAVFGTLTVLVAYLIARRAAGERAGLVAALLCAVSPILVWYSQEARSYSMLVFVSAASIWLWLRARDEGSTGAILVWATVACVAIATHYFASFIVVFEALSLWRRHRANRVLWGVLAILILVQVALIPLAVHQANANEAGDYITSTSLASRIVAIPKRFLLGETGAPAATPLFGFGLVVLIAVAAWLLLRATEPRPRLGALQLFTIAVGATLLPLCLAIAGLDFFAYRNLLAVWVLLAVCAAIGLSAPGRLATLTAAGLAAIFLALTFSVDLDPSLQRADWRYSTTALGRPAWPRLFVITPSFEGYPLQLYVPDTRAANPRRVAVREIDLIGFRIPPGQRPPAIRGFPLAVRIDHQKLSFVRYLAARPMTVDPRRIHGLVGGATSYLLQPPP